ncbi:MAG: tetratricopeptide repeat protein [Crocinitomicaceae bacterium]|nr:tetratricopeptide repeat protein [Crocinitomicaceae bacterium]
MLNSESNVTNQLLSKSKELNDYAWELNREDPRKAIKLAHEAVEIAENENCLDQIYFGYYVIGTASVWISKYEVSMKNLFKALEYFEGINNRIMIARCQYSLGTCYYYQSNYSDSLASYYSCLDHYSALNNMMGKAEAKNGIGSVFYETENYLDALNVLKESYSLLQGDDNSSLALRVLHGIGEVYLLLNRFRTAKYYFEKVIKMSDKVEMNQVFIFCHYGLAKIAKNNKDAVKAHDHLKKAINLSRSIEFKIGLAECLFLKAEVLLIEKHVDLALNCFDQSIEIAREISNYSIIAKYHGKMADFYEERNGFKKANFHLKEYKKSSDTNGIQKHGMHMKSLQVKLKMEKVANENKIYKIKNKELKRRSDDLNKLNSKLETVADLGQELASKLDFEELLELISSHINKVMKVDILYVGLLDRDKNIISFPFYMRSNERINREEISMENEGKFSVWCIKNERDLVINDMDKEATSYIITSDLTSKLPASVMIVLLRVENKTIGVLGIHSFDRKAFSNDKVSVVKSLGAYVSIALMNAQVYKKINNLYSLLEIKNKEILDSINYSQRLQQAIFPKKKLLNEKFKGCFIFYRPRDIISGDFYWMQQVEDRLAFALADSTGHGVPGALVSLVCSNALDRSVNELGLTDPSLVIDKAREYVVQTFNKSSNEVRDGMDLSFCVFEGNKVYYSGANSSLWIVRKNEHIVDICNDVEIAMSGTERSILELKGDKQPVGVYENMFPFSQKELELIEGDIIYMFSDGYADQFGGKQGKKLKRIAFKKIILELANKPFEEQQIGFEKHFLDWKGEYDQVDDVSIIGILF